MDAKISLLAFGLPATFGVHHEFSPYETLMVHFAGNLSPPQAFWKSSTSVCVLNFLLEAPSIFPFQNTLTPDAASFHLYRGRPWKLRARLRPHLRQCRIFNSLDAYSTSLIFRATTIVSFREVYEILHCLWCIPHFLTSSRRFRYTFSPHKSI